MAARKNTQEVKIKYIEEGVERLDRHFKSLQSALVGVNREIQKLATQKYASPAIKAIAAEKKPVQNFDKFLQHLGKGNAMDALVNTIARTIDQSIKAATSRKLINYQDAGIRLRTMAPADNQRDLEQQIRAMRARVASAEETYGKAPTERNQKILENEVKALERFIQARQRLKDMEAAAQREKMELVRAEERLNRLRDERHIKLQREISLERELAYLKNSQDPEFRNVRDQQSMTAARDRERRKVDQYKDLEAGFHRESLRLMKEEESIRNRIQKIDEKIALQARSGNELERTKLATKRAELRVELERNQIARGYPDQLERAVREYVQLRSHQEGLIAAQKEEKKQRQEIERLDKRLVENARRVELAELKGNTVRATRLRMAAEELKFEKMKKLGIDQSTEAYKQQEAVIRRISQELRGVEKAQQIDGFKDSIGNRNKALNDPQGALELFKLQARLLVNYQVMAAISNTIRQNLAFIPQFDAEMTQLQAITATTTMGMIELEQTIIKVSEGMKFTALEVAQAATVLGQAGFSAREIGDALEGVATLATATGSTLAQAVDVMTAAISVFNMRASETQLVANVVTDAINNSRLTMERFTLGMQYAANTAADAGVSFTEFTAVLAAFANSGIRAGSMLGTGLRQMLIDIQNPSEDLKKRFLELGLTMDDVSVNVHGILGVLENLQRAGFTTGDAMQHLQVRAANAFSAISRNAVFARELQSTLILSDAAIRAADVQLDSFTNTLKITDSILKTISYRLGNDFLGVMQKILAAFNSFLQLITDAPEALRLIGALASSVAVGGVSLLMARVTGLTAIVLGFKKSTDAATVSVSRFRRALDFLSRHPFMIGYVALTTAITYFATAAEETTTKVQEAARAVEETTERLEIYEERVASVEDQIDKLLQRYVSLDQSQHSLNQAVSEAQVRFGELGLQIDSTVNSAEALLTVHQDLRRELAKGLPGLYEELAAGKQHEAQTGFANFLSRYGRDIEADEVLMEVFRQAGLTRMEDVYQPAVRYDGQVYTEPEYVGEREVIDAERTDLATVQKLLDSIIPKQVHYNNLLVERPLKPEEEKERDRLNRIVGELRGISTALQQRDYRLQQATEQNVVRDIVHPLIVEPAERLMAERAERLAQIEAGSVVDRERKIKEINEDIDTRLDALVKRVEPLVQSKLGADPNYSQDVEISARTLISNSINNILGEVKKGVSESTQNVKTLEKDVLEQRLAYLDRAIGRASRLGRHMTVTEAQQRREEAIALAEERRRLRIQHAKDIGQLSVIDVDGARQNYLDEEIAEADEEFRQVVESFNEFFRRFDFQMEKSTREWEDFGKKLRETERNYKQAVEKALLPGQLLDMSIQQASATPENLRNVSQARIRQMQREREALRVPELHDKQAELLTGRENIQRQLSEARAMYAGYEEELAQLYARKSNFGGSEPQLARLNSDISKLEEKMQKLGGDNGDISKAEAALESINIAIEENAHQIAAADQGAQTWSETWNTLLDELMRGGGELKSATTLVSDTLTAGFDATRSGLGQLVQDVLSGTESISEAFRKMAASIIESMLEIAAHELAGQLFGMVVQGITGGLSFGGSKGVSQPTHHNADGSVNFAGLYRLGGIVRAATGKAVVGRDSKLILAEPGEAILRKSAVDVIGREGFEEINSLGNRTISKSRAPHVMPKPRDPDMVNVYVVAPDQVPPPSPKEIVAVIGKDIAQRGPTRQLIKQVAMGAI